VIGLEIELLQQLLFSLYFFFDHRLRRRRRWNRPRICLPLGFHGAARRFVAVVDLLRFDELEHPQRVVRMTLCVLAPEEDRDVLEYAHRVLAQRGRSLAC
jgi:hypothetical protein